MMIDTLLPFLLLCFTSLFTITNPLSMMPVFLTMTHSMDEKARRNIVRKASIIACITLILFVLAGQFLFKFFGILKTFFSKKVLSGVWGEAP